MKIIQQLTGPAVEGHWQEEHGIRGSVLDEPRPGVIRYLHISEKGLTMRRGKVRAGITLAAIIQLLEAAEPDLRCPPEPKLTPDQIPPEIINEIKQA